MARRLELLRRRGRRGAPRAAAALAEGLERRVLLATFIVTNVNDAGTGSLREAITQANAQLGDDTITFNLPPGAHTVRLASALPNLSSNVQLLGPGAELLTIRRETGGDYRIFNVSSGVTVTMSGMTLNNGFLNDSGGGILNDGTLTLANLVVTGNTSYSGGGIFSTGHLTLSNCAVLGNVASGFGGGVANWDGVLSVSNSVVASNSSGSNGGAIGNYGTLTLSHSSIDNNTAGYAGGGLSSSGTLNVTNSSFVANAAQTSGGISADGTINISECSISENVGNYHAGGLYLGGGTVTLTRSTIAGNSSGSFAAGLYNSAATTVVNCTIADNTASGQAATGGIWNSGGFLALHSVTVAGNSGTWTAGLHVASGTVVAYNSIVSLNTGASDNVWGTYSGSHNLIGHANPGLELDNSGKPLLKNNGGPTQTIALVAGSAAVNAGNALLLPAGVTTDQRGAGFPRVRGGALDIGAFERPGESLIVTTAIDENDGSSDPGVGAGTSLREAIVWANANPGPDVITFALPPGHHTVNLSGALPEVVGNLTLLGPGGSGLLTIQHPTGGGDSVISVPAGTSLTLSGLSFAMGGVAVAGTLNLTAANGAGGTHFAQAAPILGPGTVQVLGGTHAIAANVGVVGNLPLALLSVASGAVLNFSGPVLRTAGVNLQQDARMTLLPESGSVLAAGTLALAPTATLDLGDNAMIVRSGAIGACTGSTYTGISGLLASGRAEGAWNGCGIASCAAAGCNDYFTLGIARAGEALGLAAGETALWRGQVVDAESVLVKFTYGGDANLDGVINIDDYGQIDFHVGLSGLVAGYFNGDFNLDGLINIDDYGMIDFNVGIQGDPIEPAASVAARAAVAAEEEAGWIPATTRPPAFGAEKAADRVVRPAALLLPRPVPATLTLLPRGTDGSSYRVGGSTGIIEYSLFHSGGDLTG